jgi:hypothetical protein
VSGAPSSLAGALSGFRPGDSTRRRTTSPTGCGGHAGDATFDAALERIPDVALFVRFVVRVALEWRWRGETTARPLRDGEVVRQALAADPIFVGAQAVDARLYREFTPVGRAS